jgi:hypothetical protein
MKSTVIVTILVILSCLAFVVPGSAVITGIQQGILVQAHQSSGTSAFLTSYASPKQIVAVWQPAIIISSPARQTLVSENQLISSYAALISSGSSFAYPGGMAATMGGGGCGGS